MIPQVPNALRMLSQRILSHLVPNTASSYAMSDGAMVAMLMNALAQELESGIAHRLADIDAMKVIFRDAANLLDELPEAMGGVLDVTPAEMTMSAVNAVHDDHARVLVALHEAVDVEKPDAAQDKVNTAIWQYLQAHAARHMLPF